MTSDRHEKPQAHHPRALPRPRFRYSPCVQAGPFLRFAGMIALDRDSGALEAGGPGAEAAKILDNLVRALPELGLSLRDMVSATIYTTAFEQFPEINAAWEAVFADVDALPARTSVGVQALPLGASVEISFDFYRAT